MKKEIPTFEEMEQALLEVCKNGFKQFTPEERKKILEEQREKAAEEERRWGLTQKQKEEYFNL